MIWAIWALAIAIVWTQTAIAFPKEHMIHKTSSFIAFLIAAIVAIWALTKV